MKQIKNQERIGSNIQHQVPGFYTLSQFSLQLIFQILLQLYNLLRNNGFSAPQVLRQLLPAGVLLCGCSGRPNRLIIM